MFIYYLVSWVFWKIWCFTLLESSELSKEKLFGKIYQVKVSRVITQKILKRRKSSLRLDIAAVKNLADDSLACSSS